MTLNILGFITYLIGKTWRTLGLNPSEDYNGLMMMMKLWHFLASGTSSVTAYENGYGPGYGTQWLLFTDENGTTHKMNFSVIPMGRSGFIFGRVYCYLYTR